MLVSQLVSVVALPAICPLLYTAYFDKKLAYVLGLKDIPARAAFILVQLVTAVFTKQISHCVVCVVRCSIRSTVLMFDPVMHHV